MNIATKDEQKLEMTVTEAEPNEITGDVAGAPMTIATSKIEQLEVTELSGGKTAALVGGTGLVVALIVGIIALLASVPAMGGA